MSDKRVPRRSLDDWMELVTECRQSGLTDAAWCEAQGISPSCFYNAVSRLRKRACQIPDPIGKASTLDLTSHKQDVVQIAIDELCAIIQEQFSMEIDHSLYLFCGRKCDRIKAILKEPDGIVMIYKRLTAQGSYRWPRDKSEVRNLTWREFDWLMSGIDIEQPKAIKTT